MQSVSTFSGLTLWELGGGGTGCGNYMLTEPGKDPSHLQFSNSEACCPAPCPVTTYGSCFLTCLVISFKKPYKGRIFKKCLKQLRKKTKSFRIRFFSIFLYLIICGAIWHQITVRTIWPPQGGLSQLSRWSKNLHFTIITIYFVLSKSWYRDPHSFLSRERENLWEEREGKTDTGLAEERQGENQWRLIGKRDKRPKTKCGDRGG
jgi:hypothetical protein